MCRIVSQEQYLDCGHVIKCYLNHGLLYCKAPNGIPFTGQAVRNRLGSYPSRFCPEETWQDSTTKMDGFCPSCVRQSEETEWEGVKTIYRCRHSRVDVPGRVLQGCFSPNWRAVADVLSGKGETIGVYAYSRFGLGLGKFLGFDTLRQLRCGPVTLSYFTHPSAQSSSEHAGNNSALQDSLEDIEIEDFCNGRDDMRFSWKKFGELHLQDKKSSVACPECQRIWTRRKMELCNIMDIDENQTSGENARYRARKPKGLELELYIDDYFRPQAEAVRGRIEGDGEKIEEDSRNVSIDEEIH
ncbi:hypothetical protein PRK78_002613 [Emydomyces testavorans]|uniref:Uncharacterized protein n=1 Tax=Emydomyces testavorans TaxID=2070801 RepID=A0AAF0DEM1_9EURO|nr:hypothetical protein PRK78_002613 [Emydomyces testavorans]